MLHPGWKEALEQLSREGLQHGDTIKREWLYTHFSIPYPTDATPFSDARRAELRFLTQFKMFETELLTRHSMALKTVPSVGFLIVPPKEQTRWAYKEAVTEIRKTLNKGVQRLVNIDHAALDSAGRKENSDAVARLVNIQIMAQKQRRLPKMRI
jgi:hypothetical protein